MYIIEIGILGFFCCLVLLSGVFGKIYFFKDRVSDFVMLFIKNFLEIECILIRKFYILLLEIFIFICRLV